MSKDKINTVKQLLKDASDLNVKTKGDGPYSDSIRTINKSTVEKIYKDEFALTKEILKSVVVADVAMVNAAVLLAGDDVTERVKEARDKGDDPKNIRSDVRIAGNQGTINTRVAAYKSGPIPGSDKTYEKYGAASVSIKVSNSGFRDSQTSVAEALEKAIN